MFAEIRNDYMFGPAVESSGALPENGLFAAVSIDGWRTQSDDEQGIVIAVVNMSVHKDVIVCWHDNGARMNGPVLEAIEDAKRKLEKLWNETHPEEDGQ